MITFIGDFVCKPDSKGRVVLPASFKKVMSAAEQDGFVVRKDLFDDCLVLVPKSEWLKEVELLEERLSNFKSKDKRLKRAWYRTSAEIALDGNGRVLVPKRLIEKALISGEVVLLGVGNVIEMWDKKLFENQDMEPDELGSLAEELLGYEGGLSND